MFTFLVKLKCKTYVYNASQEGVYMPHIIYLLLKLL